MLYDLCTVHSWNIYNNSTNTYIKISLYTHVWVHCVYELILFIIVKIIVERISCYHYCLRRNKCYETTFCFLGAVCEISFVKKRQKHKLETF